MISLMSSCSKEDEADRDTDGRCPKDNDQNELGWLFLIAAVQEPIQTRNVPVTVNESLPVLDSQQRTQMCRTHRTLATFTLPT